MKKIIVVCLVLLLSACGSGDESNIETVIASKDLNKIREKRLSLENEYNVLSDQIKLLDNAIHELDTTANIPLVTTLTAKSQVFNHFVELQGSVKTKENIIIYPEMPGILNKIYVKKGQKVSKGQLLASIDEGGLEQQVAQLEIQANLAQTTFERQKRLWDQKIGSEIAFLQAKSNYEAQNKSVKQLKIQLDKTRIKAPFSGVIDDIMTDEGTVVNPGQSPIIRIVNLDNMYIEAEVPETYIKDITKNKKVEVEFPILSKTMEAAISQAGNFINPANRTFKVEVAIPNKDENIKPNLTAKIRINDYKNNAAILIPQGIISENANGQQYIYVVKNKTKDNEVQTEKAIITTGKLQGDLIEVLSGIDDGTEIIEEGARSIREGQIVKILN
ncbi:MAG: efflux RND transporter periplasmic adaptor subunit [Flavobacteriaceae bacterium]|nr:efflux RND transporter periplasmic adaptor subunit [Flavobacteriaceae bacterium]